MDRTMPLLLLAAAVIPAIALTIIATASPVAGAVTIALALTGAALIRAR